MSDKTYVQQISVIRVKCQNQAGRTRGGRANYLGASGATGAAERSQIGNLGQIHGPYACLDATHPVRIRKKPHLGTLHF